VLDLTEAAGDPRAAADTARTRLEPEADLHASADYRRHLAGVLTERALTQALASAATAQATAA
jgi:carbon-monoxide dehydrogenase medium subunit